MANLARDHYRALLRTIADDRLAHEHSAAVNMERIYTERNDAKRARIYKQTVRDTSAELARRASAQKIGA